MWLTFSEIGQVYGAGVGTGLMLVCGALFALVKLEDRQFRNNARKTDGR